MSSEMRRVTRYSIIDEKYAFLQERGLLFLEDEIDDATSSTFPLDLMFTHKNLDPNKPIRIWLKSPGGMVHYGFAIYDAIRMVSLAGRRIEILSSGLVASMATVILQAGSAGARLSLPNAQFLLHQVSETIIYKREEATEQEERAEETKRVNNIVMGIIANRSGIDVEELKSRCRKTDYWLDPTHARELGSNGLIDQITDGREFINRI